MVCCIPSECSCQEINVFFRAGRLPIDRHFWYRCFLVPSAGSHVIPRYAFLGHISIEQKAGGSCRAYEGLMKARVGIDGFCLGVWGCFRISDKIVPHQVYPGRFPALDRKDKDALCRHRTNFKDH